jgi:hypothetical protein
MITSPEFKLKNTNLISAIFLNTYFILLNNLT